MTEKEYKLELENKDKIIDQYKREVELLKKQVEYYKREAYVDTLTKLNNRRAIKDIGGYNFVIMGDIDHFKNINDQYGHVFGDKILVEISKILKECVKDNDLLCRYGGEEFVIFIKNSNPYYAYCQALFLKEKIETLGDKYGFPITMSFGITNLHNKTMNKAIEQADIAMYESKKNGRNMVSVYELK